MNTRIERASGNMFWYVFTGTHYHIHCEMSPNDTNSETGKVIQVQIIPDCDGIEDVVKKIVERLNNAARFWSYNRWNL